LGLIVLGIGVCGWLGFRLDENLGNVEKNMKDDGDQLIMYHSDGLRIL
jgi:hypothetical protein